MEVGVAMHRRHCVPLLLVALLVFAASASAGSKSAQAPGQLAIDESLAPVTGIGVPPRTLLGGSGSRSGSPSDAYRSARLSSLGRGTAAARRHRACRARQSGRRGRCRTGTLLFKGDFSNWPLGNVHNLSSIAPWSWFNDPAPSSPHPPSIVVDPYGSGEHVFAATVDPQDDPGYSSSTTRVDMVGPVDSKLARPGLDAWWYVEMAFPSKAVNGAAYFPTNGDWNWNIQWHANTVGKSGTQPFAMGISTGQRRPFTKCGGNGSSNINWQLFYYQAGGIIVNGVKPAPTRVCTRKVIAYDRWYRILTHVHWATDATGITKTWINGRLVRSIRGPTLFTDRGTGAIDTPYFLLGNYRWMGQTGGVNFSSTILYKKARIGTTRSSVLP
jgi:hypothetical protein